MSVITVDAVIAGCLKLKAAKDALVEKHKAELAPINEGIRKSEAWLQQSLQSQGLQNFKGANGIAFLQTSTSVTVRDWEATLQWIREGAVWDFLEKRVSKSVVAEYMEQHGEIPPGVAVAQEVEVRVRKA